MRPYKTITFRGMMIRIEIYREYKKKVRAAELRGVKLRPYKVSYNYLTQFKYLSNREPSKYGGGYSYKDTVGVWYAIGGEFGDTENMEVGYSEYRDWSSEHLTGTLKKIVQSID